MNWINTTHTFLALLFTLGSISPLASAAERPQTPRLVLQITVDQLRGDLPTRYRERLGEGALPNTPLLRSVLNNFNPKRSGDIYVVFEAHRFINDFDGLVVAATHGSPWSYDTYVPIIVAAPGVEPRTVHRRVSPLDIAPTLAVLVGAKPPSGAEGNPLLEIVEH